MRRFLNRDTLPIIFALVLLPLAAIGGGYVAPINQSGSGATFDPITPGDGNQNITGTVSVSNDLYVTDELSAGSVAFIGNIENLGTGQAVVLATENGNNSAVTLQAVSAGGLSNLVTVSPTLVKFADIDETETLTWTSANSNLTGTGGALSGFATVAATTALRLTDSNVQITETGTNDMALTADNAVAATFSSTGLVLVGSMTESAYTRKEWLTMAQGPTGLQTAVAQNTFQKATFSVSAINCAWAHWIVPPGYVSTPVFRIRERIATAGDNSTAWILQLNTYILPWTDSATVLPSATYASGNTTVNLAATYAADDVVPTSFTATGSYAVGDHVAVEFCRIGDDAGDTSADQNSLYGIQVEYSANTR